MWPFYAYLARGELVDGTALKPHKETRYVAADPDARATSTESDGGIPVPIEVQQVLASAAYRTVRAAVARRMLGDPKFSGSVRVNDDPDGPLLLRTDGAAISGEAHQEVTTKEIWPYLVEKHTPRYGTGAGIMVELPR